jgi:hypothetical protein
LDFLFWRVLTHERAPTRSLREVEEYWSIDDLLEANMMLDVWDDLEAQASQKARAEAQADRPLPRPPRR